MMPGHRELLETNGFFIVNSLVLPELISQSLSDIKNKISRLSEELGVSTADYLSCTGRWGTQSQVTKNVSQTFDTTIQRYFEKSLECKLVHKKSNVICKTADLIDAVPFHQDISYSSHSPYHFSVWLALNNVNESSGALQIIEDSHKWEIQPLVDFWDPYFSDQYSENREIHKIKSLPISAGDAIVFDSRLWHGSDKNVDAKDRFAYVTRWVIKDKHFPSIPKPQPSVFGILNCGEITESILRKYICQSSFNEMDCTTNNMEELIKCWLVFLADATANIAEVNTDEAKRSLNRLLILNRASKPTTHDAGDIAGKTYKNLWFSLLLSLNNKVNVVKCP